MSIQVCLPERQTFRPPVCEPAPFELWQRSRDGQWITVTKKAEGDFRDCLGTALRSTAGVFEIWNCAGVRLVSFVVGVGGIRV